MGVLKMMRQKVYISGPVSGTSDYKERFEVAEKRLVDKGYTVINPVKVDANLPDDTTWAEYLAVDMELLQLCDAIYFLKGWEKSDGAIIEHGAAIMNNMTRLFEGEDDA